MKSLTNVRKLANTCTFVWCLCFGFSANSQVLRLLPQADHEASVTVQTIFADRLCLSGDEAGVVVVREITTGIIIHRIVTKGGSISCIDYWESNGNGLIAVGTNNSEAIIYEVNQRGYRLKDKFAFSEPVHMAKVIPAPDSSFVIFASHKKGLIARNSQFQDFSLPGEILSLAHHPGDDFVYLGSNDKAIYVFSLKDYKATKRFELGNLITAIDVDPLGRYVGYGNYNPDYDSGEFGVIDLKTNEKIFNEIGFALQLDFVSPDSLLFIDGSSEIQLVEISKRKRSVVSKNSITNFSLVGHSTLVFVSEGKLFYKTSAIESKAIQINKEQEFPQKLLFEQEGKLLVAYKTGYYIWDMSKFSFDPLTLDWSPFRMHGSSINPLGNYLFDGNYIQTLNLYNSGIFDYKPIGIPTEKMGSAISKNGSITATLNSDSTLNVYQYKHEGYYSVILSDTIYDDINRILFTLDNSFLIALGNKIHIWNLSSLEKTATDFAMRNSNRNLPVVINSNTNAIITAISATIYNNKPMPESEGWKNEWHEKEGKYLCYFVGGLAIWNPETGEKTYFHPLGKLSTTTSEIVSLQCDSATLFLVYSTGMVLELDAKTYQFKRTYLLRSKFGIDQAIVSSDGRFCYTLTNQNQNIEVFETKEGKKLSDLIFQGKDKFLIVDTAGYYKRSETATDLLAYSFISDLFQQRTIDKPLHQPQIIESHFNSFDTGMVASNQRLTAANKSKQIVIDLLSVPRFSVLNSLEIPSITKSAEMLFKIKVAANPYLSQDLHIELETNLSVEHFAMDDLGILKADQTSEHVIPLQIGENIITVYVVNKNGISSNSQTFKVIKID